MDTSDETDIPLTDGLILTDNFISGQASRRADPKPSTSDRPPQETRPTPEEQAEQIIQDAEQGKAQMFGVKGRETLNFCDVTVFDQDYQMIDAHLDETLKKKIVSYDYVDFSKLLTRHKAFRYEDQRMEIINKNGMTFLSPVSECDHVYISSYSKWEQAFRVYSNVLTAAYPHKVTELLQYNHTIHTASASYIWENVYSYDREFRHHIS